MAVKWEENITDAKEKKENQHEELVNNSKERDRETEYYHLVVTCHRLVDKKFNKLNKTVAE